MSEFFALYAESGMVGVAAALLVFLVISLSRKADAQQRALERVQIDLDRQTTAVRNVEQIVIKLIDRWAEERDRGDRRHDDLSAVITDLRGDLNYVRGRINGK